MPARGRDGTGLVHEVLIPELTVMSRMLGCEHEHSEHAGWYWLDQIDGVAEGQVRALPGCGDCMTIVLAPGPGWRQVPAPEAWPPPLEGGGAP